MKYPPRTVAFVAIMFATALASSVLIGDEVRGFIDGMSIGFSDSK